jgi:uncharacterized membrane protein
MGGEILELAMRWTHVVAAVLWVGLTYVLAWVLPRPLDRGLAARLGPWLRWSALGAWLAGAALLFLLYYSGAYAYFADGGELPASADALAAFAVLAAGFVVYDPPVAWAARRGSGAGAELGPVLLLGAALGFAAWLEARGVSRRAVIVHAGGFLATAMLANLWLRIAPALRAGTAELRRARHNARLSVPVLALMASSDQPSLLGPGPWLATLGIVLLVGYGLGWWFERALSTE